MTVTLAQMVSAARAEVSELPLADARERLDQAAFSMVLDVREPGEYADGHIPDAINVPRGLLEIRADPASPAHDQHLIADRSAPILVYCTKGPGARSLLAAQTLTNMGYERVDVLDGGLIAWAEAGLPVERAPDPAGRLTRPRSSE